MICLLLIIMVIFINGIENAEQKVKHLHTVLKEEDIDAKTKAWLLMVESGRVDNEEMRRITPKSIFIAPLLANPNIKCKDGYRYDHLGQCVKVFQPDPKLQLELLLKKLNKLYSEKKEQEEEQEESNKRISEPSNGPLQFSIPVSINVDKDPSTSSDSNIKSEPLQIDKAEKIQVDHNQTSIKSDSLRVDDMFQKMQLEDNKTLSKLEPLPIIMPFELKKQQEKNNPTLSHPGLTETASFQFTPVSVVPEPNVALSNSNMQVNPPSLDDKLFAPEKIQQHPPLPLPINKLNEQLMNRPHYFSTPESVDNDKNVKLSGTDSKPRPFGFYDKLFAFDTLKLQNNYTESTPMNDFNETLKNGSLQFFTPVTVEKNVSLFKSETKQNLFEENAKPLVQEKVQTTNNISSVLLDREVDKILSNGSLPLSTPVSLNIGEDLNIFHSTNNSDSEEIDGTFFTTENIEVKNNYNLSDPLSGLNTTLNKVLMQLSTPESTDTERSIISNFYNEQESTEIDDAFSVSEKMVEDNNQTMLAPDNMIKTILENESFNVSTPVPMDVRKNVTSFDSNIKSNPALVDDKLSVVPEKVENNNTLAEPLNRLNGKFSLSFLAQPTNGSIQFSDRVSSNTEKNSDLLNSSDTMNASSSLNDKLPVPEKVQIENKNLPIPLNRLNGTFSLSILAEPSHEPLQFSIPVSIDVEKDVKSMDSDAIIKRLNGTFSLLIG